MADRKSSDTGGLPEQAAQPPQEAAQTSATAVRTESESGSTTSGTTLATDGFTHRFVHPDHPGVTLTPKGPVDAQGNRTELTAEQAKAFKTAATRQRLALREIPTQH